MDLNTKLMTEFIKELKEINNNLKGVTQELQSHSVQLAEVQQTYRKEQETFNEIIKNLQDPQKVVDFQIGRKEQERKQFLKELKERLTSAGQVLGPDMVGMRTNTKIMSSFDEPLYETSKPYLQAVAEQTVLGGVTTIERIYDRTGRRTAVSTSVLQDLNDNVDNELLTAQQLRIVSSSANDTTGGSGIQTVIAIGLDSNGLRIAEAVNMSGTTPVTTTNSFKNIDWFSNWGAGTYGGGAAGNITCTNTGATITYAQILAGGWMWRSGRFYVASNVTKAYLNQWVYGAFKQAVRFEIFTTPGSDLNTIYPRVTVTGTESGGQILFPAPLVIPSGGRILIKAIGATTGAEAYTSFAVSTQ